MSLKEWRESFVWAIRWNHSWDSAGYGAGGFWYALFMIGGLICSVTSGSYLGLAIFSALSSLGIWVGIQIGKIIHNMDFKIQIWSAVRLKSGGPEMTVTSCKRSKEGNESYTCKWKDTDGQLNMSDFPFETLDVIT